MSFNIQLGHIWYIKHIYPI